MSLFGGSFFAWNNLYLCVYLLNRTVIIWLNSLHPLPVPLSFNQTFTDNFYFLSLFCFLILEWFGFFCFSPPAFLLLFVSLLLFLALEEDMAAKELFYIVQMACDLNCTAEGICRRSPNSTVRGHYEICHVLLYSCCCDCFTLVAPGPKCWFSFKCLWAGNERVTFRSLNQNYLSLSTLWDT